MNRDVKIGISPALCAAHLCGTQTLFGVGYWHKTEIGGGECTKKKLATQEKGFIDKEGNEILPCLQDWVGPFYNGAAYFRRGNEQGYINRVGKVLFTLPYQPEEPVFVPPASSMAEG